MVVSTEPGSTLFECLQCIVSQDRITKHTLFSHQHQEESFPSRQQISRAPAHKAEPETITANNDTLRGRGHSHFPPGARSGDDNNEYDGRALLIRATHANGTKTTNTHGLLQNCVTIHRMCLTLTRGRSSTNDDDDDRRRSGGKALFFLFRFSV